MYRHPAHDRRHNCRQTQQETTEQRLSARGTAQAARAPTSRDCTSYEPEMKGTTPQLDRMHTHDP